MSTGGSTGPSIPDEGPEAVYVFRATIRLDPDASGVWTEPDEFETAVYRQADAPGDEGWRYFRDNLWKSDLADPERFREIAAETLGVPVATVSFSELRTSQSYLDDLRAAIADDLDDFNATNVDEVLSKYLGSSIRVVDS